MKTVFIIRHAKSSWNDPGLSDFDRPLNGRGEASLKVMQLVLAKYSESIDLVYSSTAVRALSTAKYLVHAFQNKDYRFEERADLYHADYKKLFEVLTTSNNALHSLAFFGHNPGLTDFYNYLASDYLDNLPTCGMVKLSFNTNDWAEISAGSAKVVYLEYPKKHGDFED